MIAIVAGIAFATAACAQDGPNVGLDTMQVQAGTCTLTLEVVKTPKQSAIGLMHRESMPADRGMVFPIPKGQRANFWMKNTLIPLDIAFLSEDWVVLKIAQMQPLELTGVPGPDGTRIAVEVNENRYAECGVAVGDQITAAE
ncbi:MAG: DUF192 domain-containing protein, partial [Pseudomonadota bacterium]